MGHIKCEITTNMNSEMFTVEVKSKSGKIYQKRSSFLDFQQRHPSFPRDSYKTAVVVLIFVDYGDVITATRGFGFICLTDISSEEFSGKGHMLSVKPIETDSRYVKEVKVTKENVRVPPHNMQEEIMRSKSNPKAKEKRRPSTSVWDA